VARGTDGRWNSTRAFGTLRGSQFPLGLQGEGEGLGGTDDDFPAILKRIAELGALAAALVLMLATTPLVR
jgi:hypothetical protein